MVSAMLWTVTMDMHSHSVLARRMEVVETGRRRRFSESEKLRIVQESFAGNRQASATARRHDISNSLLFRWRRAYRAGALGEPKASPSFVQATIVESAAAPAPQSETGPGRMEIVVASGRRVIVAADVDAAALARVLDVLEGR